MNHTKLAKKFIKCADIADKLQHKDKHLTRIMAIKKAMEIMHKK